MVEQKQETEIKFKTVKQEMLLAKLLQSSALTKRQRDFIVDKVSGRLITSYDASVLIAFLLAKIKFHKHFGSGRKHKVAQCCYCGNRINLKRYEHNTDGKRCWVCEYCSKQEDFKDHVEVKKVKAVEPAVDKKGNVKAVKAYFPDEEMKELIVQKQEKADDMYRKYIFPCAAEDQQDKICARCEENPADQSNLCGACLDELNHM